MIAAAFLGLAYCALPTLLFGVIRPHTVSIGRWPKTRRDVVGLAFLQALVGLVGFGLSYQGGKFGLTVSMHNLSLAIFAICSASALVRLIRGPRAEPAAAPAAAATGKPAARRKTARKTARTRAPAAATAPVAAPVAAPAAAPAQSAPPPPPLPLDQFEPQARADMRTAMANMEKLRRWVGAFDGHPLQGILGRIAEHADATLQEVIRDPGDFARVRKALVHYLDHVIAVLDHLATVHIGTGRQELLDRTASTLERLVPVFASYRDKAFENDAFQLDARLEVLDQEILAHGPQPRQAAGN